MKPDEARRRVKQVLELLPEDYKSDKVHLKFVKDHATAAVVQHFLDVSAGIGSQQTKELVLSGRVSMGFQGRNFHIPVSIYIPADYPKRCVTMYVHPEPPGVIPPMHPHVSEQGIVYLPYLHDWNPRSSNIVQAIYALTVVFSTLPFVCLPVSSAAPPSSKPIAVSAQQQQPQQQFSQSPKNSEAFLGRSPPTQYPMGQQQQQSQQSQQQRSYGTPPMRNSGSGSTLGIAPPSSYGSAPPIGFTTPAEDIVVPPVNVEQPPPRRGSIPLVDFNQGSNRFNQRAFSGDIASSVYGSGGGGAASSASNASLDSTSSLRKLTLMVTVGTESGPRRCEVETDSIESLSTQLKSKLQIQGDIILQYLDPKFNDYVLLEDMKRLPDVARVQIKTKTAPAAPTSDTRYFTEIDFGELRLGAKIGGGSYKTVWEGEWRGTPVAIGQLSKAAAEETDLGEFRHELQLLAQLAHPNVVLLIGAVTNPSAEAMCIVTELMPKGSLYDVVHKRKEALSLPTKLGICKDMCNGLNFLHQSGVSHRDIKSLNILIDDKYTAKVTDFGLSKKKSQGSITTMAQTKCGTMLWMAPEIMRNEAYNPIFADVYSMGLVLYEVLSGNLPFDHVQSDFQLLIEVAQKGVKPQLQPGPNVPAGMVDLMNWTFEAAGNRPTMEQLCREMREVASNTSYRPRCSSDRGAAAVASPLPKIDPPTDDRSGLASAANVPSWSSPSHQQRTFGSIGFGFDQ